MKVMKIGNYTNQYSTDKAKLPSQNPNFGITDAKALRQPALGRFFGWLAQAGKALDNIFGFTLNHMPDTARRIIGFKKPEDVAAVQGHFDKSTQHLSDEVRRGLQLVVEISGESDEGVKVVNASVAGQADRFGLGQVLSTGNDVEAAKQAITSAVRGYEANAGLDKAYSRQRRSALTRVARDQDAVSKFTAG